jgi:transposase
MGYSAGLTDKQWQFIEKMLEDKDRKRKHSLHSILNSICYFVKTRCQWRMLPCDFAPLEYSLLLLS